MRLNAKRFRLVLMAVVLIAPFAQTSLHADEQQPGAPSPLATPRSRGYVQMAPLLVIQPSGIPNHRVKPAIEGKTAGLAAAAGVYIAPALAIEGEFALDRTISTPQRFSYNWREDYIAKSRDLFVGANLRWSPSEERDPRVIRRRRTGNQQVCQSIDHSYRLLFGADDKAAGRGRDAAEVGSRRRCRGELGYRTEGRYHPDVHFPMGEARSLQRARRVHGRRRSRVPDRRGAEIQMTIGRLP